MGDHHHLLAVQDAHEAGLAGRLADQFQRGHGPPLDVLTPDLVRTVFEQGSWQTNRTGIRTLSQNERDLLNHETMWGSACYPIVRLGRGWVVTTFFGVNGPPVVFKTKKAATAAFENTLALLRTIDRMERMATAPAAND